ncbi:uncharacterized protein ARB_02017 [Trichophyton benhamiae CBS 112371]|uniref:Uncharacterized protein n=1 Tax=Arthroderma benhamiae (strain ATCC MYA-4681 / CBS 112371) TaxID=663331 RepID=D4B0P1_ARTBC|nr:uncharacterized protein ARB_02017 [Trichophyton benhamiae CBS 112371]EFE31148.1 hypothetical protein ARB_02017 [Trichophyton benhamiae CBS 112371]
MLELEGNKQAAVSEKVDQQDQQERQLCRDYSAAVVARWDGDVDVDVGSQRATRVDGAGGGASPALLPNHGELLERPASNVLASITSTHHPAQLQLSPGHALTAILCTSVSPC